MESVFAQSGLGDLVAKFKKGKITVPTWQREQGVWSTQKKARLIATLLKGWYMPPIVLWSHKGKRYIVDGLQRLSTIRDFMDDGFRVKVGTKRVTYSQLSVEHQVELEERSIFVATLRGEGQDALQQFFNLNEKPAVLSSGEIFVGFYDCPVMRALRELSKTPSFVSTIGFTALNQKRLQPAEWLVNFATVMRTNDDAPLPSRRKQFCAMAPNMKDADLKLLSEQFSRLNTNLCILFDVAHPFRRGKLNRAVFLAIAPWLSSIQPEMLSPIRSRIARLYDELTSGSVIGAYRAIDPKGVEQTLTFAQATDKGPDVAWKMMAAREIWYTQADLIFAQERY